MRFLTALVALGLIASAPAQAAFPEKDITIVIPYGPGGGFDTLTRKLSPYIEEYFREKSGKELRTRLDTTSQAVGRSSNGCQPQNQLRSELSRFH